MIRHPRMIEFEKRLKSIFDEIDDYLEENYGDLFPLHPARAKKGKTSNKAHDGLFSVTSSFTTGIGSQKGKGYVVSIRFVTLKKVDKKLKEKIENEAMQIIDKKLDEKFPEREIDVTRDGKIIKIIGDFNMGIL